MGVPASSQNPSGLRSRLQMSMAEYGEAGRVMLPGYPKANSATDEEFAP